MKRCIVLLLLLAGCSAPQPPPPAPLPQKFPPPPAKPTALRATQFASAPKSYSVQLVWDQYRDPTANSISVWQGSSVIQQVPPQTTSIFVGGLSYRVQYFWHLTALGTNGESAPSGTVGYWKQNAQQPGVPSGSLAQ